jgi:hypothetical protein
LLLDSATVDDTNWHHVVVTWDNTTNANGAKIYINGSLSSQGTSTATTSFSFTNSTTQLMREPGGSLRSDGKLDQVRIFNKAITSEEVETLYNEVQCIPTIVPTDYFNPVLYTGNSTNDQSVTAVGFQPDFVWIKSRNTTASGTTYHGLWDSVRGTGGQLYSSLPNEETNTPNRLYSFDLDGFSLGNGVDPEYIGNRDYVAWNWKSGGAPTTTNSAGAGNVPTAGSVKIDGADSTTALAGTIAATSISANTEAGFSIVAFNKTTDGATASTFGHGLSAVPEMIILKRTDATDDWYVYHKDLGNTIRISLNTTAAQVTGTSLWGSTSPTDSVFTLLGYNAGNAIAYCFHSVDGMSDIGSYVGTGASGNSIVTGFRPAFVMIKATNLASDWYMIDNKRPNNKFLAANKNNSEYTASDTHTFTSNGFTLSGESFNNSGYNWIYMAIAEEVFVPDNFFNDDSTLATYKLDGDAGDDSGNGNNGVASNVTYAAGEFDDAAVFNGSSSGIQTGIQQGTNPFTWSAWLKPDNITTNQYAIGVYNSAAGANSSQYFFKLLSSNFVIGAYNNASYEFSTPATLGVWSHLVLTYDGTGIVGYLNGNALGAKINIPALILGTKQTLLGGIQGAGNDVPSQGWYDGSIDQVRIFDRALDSGEVEQLYNE